MPTDPHPPRRYQRSSDDTRRELDGVFKVMHIDPPRLEATLDTPDLSSLNCSRVVLSQRFSLDMAALLASPSRRLKEVCPSTSVQRLSSTVAGKPKWFHTREVKSRRSDLSGAIVLPDAAKSSMAAFDQTGCRVRPIP